MTEPANAGAAGQRLTVRYFAWVREKVGRAEERIVVPDGVATVRDLVGWLREQGPEYANAFERPDVVRAAVDQVHVKPAQPISGAREIAFFPPVTGG
ncbi:molybdopterin converting factor subunit 1 [Hyphomicrobium sp. CS1GBMeth3]|uniref:molybdopterin converting factor subunit 1 n=1 Tax=Hyphomicrobium sp. CS1GBMeth3 TaxID=1892845 RepID=UPI00092FE243|nr:molybdopterin converting factor subunit 1 [Hyphomicrobium sp. CS1GBMeth3]